jgi:hypothetical protein
MLQEITEEITDQASIIKAIEQFQSRTREFWYACVEKDLPAFSVGKVKHGYLAARSRGVKILYITDITRENLTYCREIMKVAELRHLEGVGCNFALSETEYIAGKMQGEMLVRLVRTQAKELVRQQNLVFQALWNCSTAAADRIAQLE